MKYLHIFFFLFLGLYSLVAQGVMKDCLASRLDSMVLAYGKKGLFSGYIHIIQGDRTLYSSGNGWQDRTAGTPFSDTTLFCIGSVTKIFTAAAVLVLEQQGKLRISDPAGKHIPALTAYPEITIEHLLYHTSCLPYSFWGLREKLAAGDASIRAEDLYRYIGSTQEELNCRPNSRAVYSNTGYMILGDLIERVSGVTYGEFLKRHLFNPLDMSRTTVGDRIYIGRPGYANTYLRKRRKGKYHPPTYLDIYSDFYLPTAMPGAGFIYSTPQDLVKLRNLWTSDAVLHDSTRAKIGAPWRLIDGSTSEEAYPGYMVVDMVAPLGKSYQMTGGIPGQQCLIFHSPDTDITFLYINNEIIYKNRYFSWEKCREAMRSSILLTASCAKNNVRLSSR